jgi:hypothetical protein
MIMTLRLPGRRTFAVMAVAMLTAALVACESTPQFASRVVNKPARELKSVHLVLVENELRVPGLAVTEARNEKLASYGYYELGRLLKERAPAVLAANGLRGDVNVFAPPKGGTPVELGTVGANEPILLLSVKGGREVKQGPVLHRAYLQMGTTLFDKPAPGAKRVALWDSQVSFRLGADEAIGVMLIHRVDAEFVDTLVMGLLNNMAADGMVALPHGKAARPKTP